MGTEDVASDKQCRTTMVSLQDRIDSMSEELVDFEEENQETEPVVNVITSYQFSILESALLLKMLPLVVIPALVRSA